MEQNELIRSYEMSFILDAGLPEDEKKTICDEVQAVVKKFGGDIKGLKTWIERQKMTFPIKKCEEGTYYLLDFEGEAKITPEIKSTLRLKENVLRFMIVSKEAVEA